MTKPDTRKHEPDHDAEPAHQVQRNILNAFVVERETGLADGAGPPGSAAVGDDRAGIADADEERGKRD